MPPQTRRKAIKTIGAGAVGISAGLAGCFGDDDDADDTTEPTDPEELGDPVEELTILSLAQGDGPFRYEYGMMIQENVEELGFEVEYEPEPITEYVDRQYNDPWPFDLIVRRTGDGFEPAEDNLRRFYYSEHIGDGGQNIYGYESEEVDELLNEQAAELDEERRTELIHELQEVLREDMPTAPNLIQERVMPYNADLFENPVTMPEDGLGGFWNFLQIEPTDESDGHLRTTMAEDYRAINPLDQISRGDRELVRLVFDPLMRITPDVEVEPWAAESVDLPDDTTIDITLRDGMEFHDGEPITAETVQFSYEFGAEESTWVEGRVGVLDEIEVHDDLELTFHLSEPSAPFFGSALARIMIIPPHIWEDPPADPAMDYDNLDAIGSGPFQVVEGDAEQVILEANEDHFNPPNVDRVTRVNIADMSGAVRAFEDESLEMITWELSPDDFARFEEEDWIGLDEALMTSVHHLGFNNRNEPLDDVAVRQALAHTIPKDDIVSAIYAGMAQPIDAQISSAFEEWYNDDVEPIEFDLDQARSILEEAGYGWDDEGRIHYPAE